MEYRERSETDSIKKQLEAALEKDDNTQKNRHIRESLQLLEGLDCNPE
jgi:hypothetical protein